MKTPTRVRVRDPKREGQPVTFVIAEDSLAPDHPARALWTALGTFDLSGFLDGAKAVEGTVGRGVYSPRMMLTLWGYAFSQGVVHARAIAKRIETDIGFRWIVGDILVKHSAISAFLVEHRHALVDLLADVIATLMHAGLIFLPTHLLAQDGTKVRADASERSFRTAEGLRVAREQAELHLKAMLARMDDPPLREREVEARERGAMDVLDRIKAAAVEVEKLSKARAESKDHKRSSPATASSTDPECRKMKFADGSYGPAYNIQFATVGDPAGGAIAIVGVQVTSVGSDKGSLMPMREMVTVMAGMSPTEVVADPDHVTLATLRETDAAGLEVISRVPEHWKKGSDAQDEVTRAWMTQMESDESKEIYRGRKALAERPNAIMKVEFGLDRLTVRGLDRVQSTALLMAILITLREHRDHWLN